MGQLQKGDVARLQPENVRDDNFLQRLLLSWVYGVIALGRNGRLRQEQLRMPRSVMSSALRISRRAMRVCSTCLSASHAAEVLSSAASFLLSFFLKWSSIASSDSARVLLRSVKFGAGAAGAPLNTERGVLSLVSDVRDASSTCAAVVLAAITAMR